MRLPVAKLVAIVAAVSAAMLAGCASTVDKEKVSQVKRAAIVSLFANEKVPNAKGNGVVRDWDDKVRLQVAEDALLAFSNEMQRVGWELVKPDSVVQSSEYQQTFALPKGQESTAAGKAVSFMQQLYARQFFTPGGMLPIQITDKEVNTYYGGDAKAKDKKQFLAQMAQKLNVDAVVVVQLDYCYQGGTFSMLGTGEAVITAASSVKVVNRAGQMVINMPELKVCDTKNREPSDSSMAMMQGNLLFTHLGQDRFRNMFIEATRKSAIKSVSEIVREIKG